MKSIPRQFIGLVVVVSFLCAFYFYSHREAARPTPAASPTATVPPPGIGATAPTPPAPPAAREVPALPERREPVSSIALFQPPGPPNGTHVAPNNSQYLQASTAAKAGRAAVVDRASLTRLRGLSAGDAVSIPLMDGRAVAGRVNLVTADAKSWIRAGGELTDGSGSFSIRSNGAAVSGLILLKREKIAYELEEQKDGKLWMLEKPLSAVVCDPMPREPEGMARTPREGPVEAVPILNSRPGAKEVLYLDFDGETVTDPDWNNGTTIVAASFNLSAATISSIFDRVKEDWFPFNLNVTTDVTNYNNAAAGHRMRVIITPTDTAAPGAGGVAYLTSFRNGGTSFSSTIPCWVFNSSIVSISEAISHETGHTMGLSHDGTISPPAGYYQGHGTGATSWAPIMGVGYYVNVVQWSKGEYTSANNQEDDLAIISASYNHFGYMVDDAGNTRAAANALSGNPATGAINQVGLIERTGDIDYYTFFTGTNGALVSISATDPSSSPNLDIVLELQDSNGNTIGAVSNPPAALNASISATVPQAGQYYLKVSPTGAPTPPATGYTNYGSLGQYVLTGTVQGLTQNPIVTSASTASGQVGVLFGYQIKATGNPASYGLQAPNDTLPPGLVLVSPMMTSTGTPPILLPRCSSAMSRPRFCSAPTALKGPLMAAMKPRRILSGVCAKAACAAMADTAASKRNFFMGISLQ